MFSCFYRGYRFLEWPFDIEILFRTAGSVQHRFQPHKTAITAALDFLIPSDGFAGCSDIMPPNSHAN